MSEVTPHETQINVRFAPASNTPGNLSPVIWGEDEEARAIITDRISFYVSDIIFHWYSEKNIVLLSYV